MSRRQLHDTDQTPDTTRPTRRRWYAEYRGCWSVFGLWAVSAGVCPLCVPGAERHRGVYWGMARSRQAAVGSGGSAVSRAESARPPARRGGQSIDAEGLGVWDRRGLVEGETGVDTERPGSLHLANSEAKLTQIIHVGYHTVGVH